MGYITNSSTSATYSYATDSIDATEPDSVQYVPPRETIRCIPEPVNAITGEMLGLNSESTGALIIKTPEDKALKVTYFTMMDYFKKQYPKMKTLIITESENLSVYGKEELEKLKSAIEECLKAYDFDYITGGSNETTCNDQDNQ